MKLSRNSKSILALCAFVFSAVNVYLHMAESNSFSSVGKWAMFVNIAILTPIIYCLLKSITNNIESITEPIIEVPNGFDMTDFKYCIKIFLVQITFWLIVFLAYFPGLFNYDVQYQIPQAMGSYNTHHPLIHTLYLQFFYYVIGIRLLNSINAGIVLATLTQMLLFSAMLAYAQLFLRKIGLKRTIRIALPFLFGIIPLFSLMSISLTKDVLFAGFMGCLVTGLCYNFAFPTLYEKRIVKLVYIVSVAGTILFRNNGVYPIAGLWVCLLFRERTDRSKRLNLLVHTTCGLLIGIIIGIGLRAGLHAEKGRMNEALCLPYQQIACAYSEHSDEMDDDQKTSITELIPDVSEYNPCTVDPIKNTAQGDRNVKELIRIYIITGIKYPKSYIKAAIKNNAGYLYVADITFTQIYDGLNLPRQGAYLTDTKEGFGVIHRSLLPGVEAVYESLFTDNNYRYIIVYNLFCTPSLYFWLAVYIIMLAVIMKRKKFIPAGVFMVIMLATIIAGPCALPRYILPVAVMTPPLAGLLLYDFINDEEFKHSV